MLSQRRTPAALLLVLGTVAVLAQAPPTPTPEQQKILQQVALAKARTELLERVRGLPLGPGTTIADWLARDVNLDRAVRLWVRTRPAHGPSRLYSDAVCEVDVCLLPSELRDGLLRLRDEYSAVAEPGGSDAGGLEAATRRWPVLWATGRAVRARRPLPGQPPGWEDVSRAGVELARQAALADAFHALLEQAGRLKVTHARRVHEFLDSSAAVRAAVETAVRREAKVELEFGPDQVAVAEVRVGVRDLLRILTRVHAEHYQGDQFEAADFREMALLAGREDLRGTGLAPPPSHTLLRTAYAPIEYNAPDWVAKSLTAVGRFEPADNESPDEATQLEAARLDAIDQLRKRVEQLVIQKDVTIAEFLGYHQELKEDVVLFLSGGRLIGRSQTLPAGGVEVEVELPLHRLWEIVRRAMKLEEVEPPEAPAARQPPTASAPAGEKETP